MFTQLLTLPPIPLNAAKERLRFPAAVEQVVMKALSKDPAGRYPGVMAFAEAFQQAATAGPGNGKTAASLPESDDSGILARMRGILRRG
jgi:serine/threonine-protein kinase